MSVWRRGCGQEKVGDHDDHLHQADDADADLLLHVDVPLQRGSGLIFASGNRKRKLRSVGPRRRRWQRWQDTKVGKSTDILATPKRAARPPLRTEAATRLAHNLNRLIPLTRRRGRCICDGRALALCAALAIIALSVQLECALTGAGDALRKPAALFDDDLIEGRLDTGQLCGTRYPVGPFSGSRQQLKLDKSNGWQTATGEEDEEFGRSRQQQIRGFAFGNDNEKYNHIEPADGREETSDRNSLLYIVGGDEVDDGQFWPWSVAIYELDPLNGRRAFICSGSLISDKFILTAAHCIQQSRFDILQPEEISLKIASTRLDDERNHFYQVERIFVHPDYTVDRKTNDIALLRLRHGQRLPLRARPICLPSHVANRVDFTDQQVTIIGWGKTSAMQGNEPARLIDLSASSQVSAEKRQAAATDSNDSQTNDTLLQAEVRVTSTDQCNRNYSKLEISWLNIDEHFLCASDPQGKRDACQGDSGGPLMWNNQQGLFNGNSNELDNGPPTSAAASAASAASAANGQLGGQEKWYQLGLVSFGYGCANKQYPGVYTRISYYMPWILRTVKTGIHH